MEPDDTPVEDVFFLTLERGGRTARVALPFFATPSNIVDWRAGLIIRSLGADLAKQEDPE